MGGKKAKPGDVIHEIGYQELLQSCGITLAVVAWDIINTDNMYSQEWQINTASSLAALSELLRHCLTNYQDVGWGVKIKLPEDMYGVVINNPTSGHSMTPPRSDDKGGGIDDMGEFPF